MITRLTLVARDFEGSDRATRLPQYQRHILNRHTTISDSSFVLIIAIQAMAQGDKTSTFCASAAESSSFKLGICGF